MKNLLVSLLLLLNLNLTAQDIWGVTRNGGEDYGGVIFKTDLNGNNYEVVYNFRTNIEPRVGFAPVGHPILENGKLYGIAVFGGSKHNGIIYEFDIESNTIKELHAFSDNFSSSGWEGKSLLMAKNGKIYGATREGGGYKSGILFEYDLTSNEFNTLVTFDETNGKFPISSLIQGSNDKLYGLTGYGGANDKGVLFEYDIDSNNLDVKYSFMPGYHNISHSLVEYKGKLYGRTNRGSGRSGVIFEYDLLTEEYIIAVSFPDQYYYATDCLTLKEGKLYGVTQYGGQNNYGSIYEYSIDDNKLSFIFDLDGKNTGSRPIGSKLYLGSNNELYGMNSLGGEYGFGTLFKYNVEDNLFTKIVDFNKKNGEEPISNSVIEAGYNLSSSNITEENCTIIYPNPSSDKISIESKDIIEKISILDNSGKVLPLIFISEKEIDVSKLKKGIYILNVEFSNFSNTLRFIKN